jgi:hypothetical protein
VRGREKSGERRRAEQAPVALSTGIRGVDDVDALAYEDGIALEERRRGKTGFTTGQREAWKRGFGSDSGETHDDSRRRG